MCFYKLFVNFHRMDYETDDVLANTSEELIVSLRHENNLQQDIIKGLKDQADQDKKQLTLLLMTVNNMSMMHVTCNMRLKVANRQARYIYEMLESFPIVKNMINSTDALSGSQVEERLETLIAQWSQANHVLDFLPDGTNGQNNRARPVFSFTDFERYFDEATNHIKPQVAELQAKFSTSLRTFQDGFVLLGSDSVFPSALHAYLGTIISMFQYHNSAEWPIRYDLLNPAVISYEDGELYTACVLTNVQDLQVVNTEIPTLPKRFKFKTSKRKK